MPTTEADLPEKSIPLALQALFYKMQFHDHAASTKDLTKSFGWDTAESFQQHDVQELNRVLCDKLDEKMKGTSVEGTMAALFEGHTETFLECTDVPYKSTKRESFMDLQLDVKGCRDVAASFAKYVEEEQLDGDNKYHAEEHGLQNARKGIRFISFPPVLQLQLKRFEYDPTHDAMGKVHDRYEFPTDLDLNPFLHVPPPGAPGEPAAPPPPDARYVLHSVLVHSGGVNGGHYYAFVRPCGGAGGGDWFRFDDERVTREDAAKAVDDNFGEGGSAAGGDNDTTATKWGGGGGYPPLWKSARLSSAYMLVYVRACDLDKMVFPVAETDILAHVRERLAAETAEKARKDKEKRDAHLYTVVKVARDADIAARVCARDGAAFDLVEHDKVTHIRVEKGAPFSAFKALAAEQLGVPVEAQRWWLWSKRQNATFRPSRAITAAEESTPVSAIRESPASAAPLPILYGKPVASNELLLLLEAPWSPASSPSLSPLALHAPHTPPPPLAKGDILLFFKLYDPVRETISYIGRAFVAGGTKVSDLTPVVRPLLAAHGAAPASPSAELLYYEEVKFDPVMVELMDKKATLKVRAHGPCAGLGGKR
jgi:ubiquitin carboxyl-terminal hydrolase 7